MGDQTKNAKVIIENGALDIAKSTHVARKKVRRNRDNEPVHACGLVSHRACPCWVCISRGCQACMSSSISQSTIFHHHHQHKYE